MLTLTSNSPDQTQKIAEKLAQLLKGGAVLCFYGNLGSGKTTFIQGLAKGLGIKENITSPTFVLLKQYRIKKTKKQKNKKTCRSALHAPKNFYHLDCYRLSSVNEALDLGIEEIWDDPSNIIAIEWAEKINDILPKERIDICLEHARDNKRKITFFVEGKRNEEIIKELKK